MTDREKHLSLALDALAMLNESLDDYHRSGALIDLPYHYWRQLAGDMTACIEAAAMPKPSIIRRLFTRKDQAA